MVFFHKKAAVGGVIAAKDTGVQKRTNHRGKAQALINLGRTLMKIAAEHDEVVRDARISMAEDREPDFVAWMEKHDFCCDERNPRNRALKDMWDSSLSYKLGVLKTMRLHPSLPENFFDLTVHGEFHLMTTRGLRTMAMMTHVKACLEAFVKRVYTDVNEMSSKSDPRVPRLDQALIEFASEYPDEDIAALARKALVRVLNVDVGLHATYDPKYFMRFDSYTELFDNKQLMADPEIYEAFMMRIRQAYLKSPDTVGQGLPEAIWNAFERFMLEVRNVPVPTPANKKKA